LRLHWSKRPLEAGQGRLLRRWELNSMENEHSIWEV
jgi:hypothetical protein